MENKWNDDQMKNEQDMRYQNLEKNSTPKNVTSVTDVYLPLWLS